MAPEGRLSAGFFVVTCELERPAMTNVAITGNESRLKLSKKFMDLLLDKT
jgi:hypothetical protein